MERIFVLDRVCERHPNVSKEDAAYAWKYAVRTMLRIGTDPEEHVGVGFDTSGRMIEIVALRTGEDDWLIKHAQTPPQEKIKRELKMLRRNHER